MPLGQPSGGVGGGSQVSGLRWDGSEVSLQHSQRVSMGQASRQGSADTHILPSRAADTPPEECC